MLERRGTGGGMQQLGTTGTVDPQRQHNKIATRETTRGRDTCAISERHGVASRRGVQGLGAIGHARVRGPKHSMNKTHDIVSWFARAGGTHGHAVTLLLTRRSLTDRATHTRVLNIYVWLQFQLNCVHCVVN